MLRLFTLSCMVASAVAQSGSSEELDKTFSTSENRNISDFKCTNIVGRLSGCYECYLCNNDKIQEKRSQGKEIYNLALINGDCETTQVCCLSQKQFSYRDADNSCGASNPNGQPYSLRPRLRAVLQGEYPWRAWVYSKADRTRPLCAATYIDDTARALLVPGHCVQNQRPESLVVRFSKQNQQYAIVKSMAVHNELDLDTHTNDIALLSLESFTNIPSWVKAACLPEICLPYGSTCVGISDNDNSINFLMPEQSECDEIDPQLPPSLMCAVAPPRDYRHEYGGGLFCLDNNEKRPTYTVYGIALHRSGDVVSLYTNITNFTDWIKNKISYFSRD